MIIQKIQLVQQPNQPKNKYLFNQSQSLKSNSFISHNKNKANSRLEDKNQYFNLQSVRQTNKLKNLKLQQQTIKRQIKSADVRRRIPSATSYKTQQQFNSTAQQQFYLQKDEDQSNLIFGTDLERKRTINMFKRLKGISLISSQLLKQRIIKNLHKVKDYKQTLYTSNTDIEKMTDTPTRDDVLLQKQNFQFENKLNNAYYQKYIKTEEQIPKLQKQDELSSIFQNNGSYDRQSNQIHGHINNCLRPYSAGTNLQSFVKSGKVDKNFRNITRIQKDIQEQEDLDKKQKKKFLKHYQQQQKQINKKQKFESEAVKSQISKSTTTLRIKSQSSQIELPFTQEEDQTKVEMKEWQKQQIYWQGKRQLMEDWLLMEKLGQNDDEQMRQDKINKLIQKQTLQIQGISQLEANNKKIKLLKALEIKKDQKEQFKQKIRKVQDINKAFMEKFLQDQQDNFQDMDYPYLRGHQEKLTNWEIEQVIQEMGKANKKGDFNLVESIVKRLAFFKKFNKSTRLGLLKQAKYLKLMPNQVVFNQGDEGDFMYVILSGSINVIRTRFTQFGKEDNFLVCLYDGLHFGELAMMGASADEEKNVFVSLNAIKTLQQVRLAMIDDYEKKLKEDALKEYERKNKYRILKQKKLKLIEQANERTIKRKQEQEEKQKQEDLANKSYSSIDSQTYQKQFEKDEKIDNFQQQLDQLESEEEDKDEKQTMGRRLATCKTAEYTHLLEIPRKYFRKVLLSMIKNELDKKIQVLRKFYCFRNFQPYALIPIANQLSLKTYKYGEIILKRGDIPQNLFIVSEGRCKLFLENVIVKDSHPSNFAFSLKSALNKFNFSSANYDPSQYYDFSRETELERRIKEQQIAEGEELKLAKKDLNHKNQPQQKEKSLQRMFSFCKVEVENKRKEEMAYFDTIQFGNIGIGEYFGEKSLFVNPFMGKSDIRAKLNVVCDSFQTQLLCLELKNLPYIPDYLKTALLDFIQGRKKFDDIDVKDELKKQRQWLKMKNNLYNQNLKEMAMIKNKFLFYKRY